MEGFFAEECAQIHTEEERRLLKKVIKMHERARKILTGEQSEAVEAYVEIIYELQSVFLKKAFVKGCEFATSFLLEMGNCAKA